VTVGKMLEGGFSRITPALRIVVVAVGVVVTVTTRASEMVIVSEMAMPAILAVATNTGTPVAATVAVSTMDGWLVSGAKGAAGETMGGGESINCNGPAAESVTPFTSKESTRLSSKRLPTTIRENMSMSLAQGLHRNQDVGTESLCGSGATW
jgi:hypothetical protein